MTLYNYNEVINYSRMGDQFPTCDVSDIMIAEQYEFLHCLGMDFYNELKADVIDYSNTPEWSAGTYNIGDAVKYQGLIYVAKVQTTQIPSNTVAWKFAPKFTTECFETFNCSYLGRYIALVTYKSTLPNTFGAVTANGMVQKNGNGFSAATKEVYDIKHKSVDAQIAKIYELMLSYVANFEGSCFENFGIKTDICGTCKQPVDEGCKCDKRKNKYFIGYKSEYHDESF